MNKVAKRLITFLIGLPTIMAIVFFKFYDHVLLNALVIVFSALCANEFFNMLSPTKKLFRKPVIISLATLLPVLSYNFVMFGISVELVPWFFVFSIFVLMGIEGLLSKEFTFSIEKIAYSTLIIFYSGFLPTFISRMSILENSIYILSLYFLSVFLCDSGAWLCGILFGKNNRGHFAASPNKSIVGFFGGIASSIGICCVYKAIFPEVVISSYISMIILGFFTALASIIGDLIESVFKRSTGVKDSGTLIPGRGGVMDCMDSLLIAAPVFYIGVHFLF